MNLQGVIFDLDGVIVTTDECHFQAWKRLSEEEDIYFDRQINERLRGVSRMDSLEIVLEKSAKVYSDSEKNELASRKNAYYRELIGHLTPRDILPGITALLNGLKEHLIKIAIGSSSKNTPLILERIGLNGQFDAIIDGNKITKSKPDPEVFLKAVRELGLAPQNCIVVEDAEAGIQAALAGGMPVIGVGGAVKSKLATLRIPDFSNITVNLFIEKCLQI